MDGLRKAPSKVLVLKMDEPSKIECLSRESSTSKDKEKEKEGQPVSLETKAHSKRSKSGQISSRRAPGTGTSASSHTPDHLGGLKVLFALNLGHLDLKEWGRLTTTEKFWYIPIYLCQGPLLSKEFFSSMDLDSAHQPKDDWSIRALSYWLMLAKMIPSDFVGCLGSAPEDLEATRAFFAKFVTNPPVPGDSFDSLSLSDPIYGIPYRITSLKVLKIFKAKTKPTLCEVSFENNHAPMRLIFKSGDDLRRDMYVESVFFVFNQPFIYLYRVYPSEKDTGFVEFVENSATVQAFDWSKLDSWDDEKRKKFIRSAAGAYVGAFILGVRDRHRDNMMITDDGFFLHIDFGYLFNQKTWFDANRFAIPSEMKKKLTSEQWESFLNLCGEAFGVLRRHQSLIAMLVVSTFKDMFPEDMIMECLDGAFYGKKPEKNAIAHVRELASTGEASGKKKMKDMAHTIESSDVIGKYIPKTKSVTLIEREAK